MGLSLHWIKGGLFCTVVMRCESDNVEHVLSIVASCAKVMKHKRKSGCGMGWVWGVASSPGIVCEKAGNYVTH